MKLYLFIGVFFVVLLAYWAGERVSEQKCETKIAELNAQNQSNIVKTLEVVNEKTFNTGVRDIRHILHEQYTIVE